MSNTPRESARAAGAGVITPGSVLTATAATDDRGELVRPFDLAVTLRLYRLMAAYPRQFRLSMVIAAIMSVFNLGIPFVLTETIRGPVGDPEGFAQQWGIAPATAIWGATGLMVAMSLAWYGAMRWRQYVVNDMAERVVRDMRAAIFEHLQRLGMDFYDRTKVGRILSRGTSDIDAVRGAVTQVAPRTLVSIVQMLGGLGAMYYYDATLALVVTLAAPALYLINWKFRTRLSQAYRLVQESFSMITANLAESIAGIHVTQAFVRAERNQEMFAGLCNLHRRRNMDTAREQGLYVPMMDIAGQAFIALALLLGGWRVLQHQITYGDLFGFMFMTGIFFGPISILSDLYITTLQAIAGAERIFRLLDTPPTKLDPDACDRVRLLPTDAGARVEFKDVCFEYVPGRPVLQDVSFVAEPGQTIALVGHTGSGKTSIINLAAKFYRHTKGTIAIDGIDIERITQADLHSQMGIVLQENILFTGTVLDNIAFAKPGATEEEVGRVCEALGIMDIIERLPAGLKTPVGERGDSLSMGQRQLITFARAMLHNPRLLILDEATSAVDTVTEYRVQTALARLLAGRTSFVVAHRLSTIRRADLILVVRGGRIVERGTHETLLSSADARVYRMLHEEFTRLSEPT